MIRVIYIVIFISIFIGCIGQGKNSSSKAASQTQTSTTKSEDKSMKTYTYKINAIYPHSTTASTQGLFLYDGALIESTGEYGASKLRRIDLKTGKELEHIKLPDEYFGEGAVELNGKIYQLTWREGVAFVYDAKTFKKLKEFKYSGEGWGLATDGKILYMSDGTSYIYKIDPKTFKKMSSITVTAKGNRVNMINELEWIEGELWANIFTTDLMVKIDPNSGNVNGVIDFEGLLPIADRSFDPEDVLNGIAYDSISKKIYVTGKKWNKLFEIEINEK